jgi:ubiquitin-protein ligase E3 A
MSLDYKKLLLEFVTASDRVPLKGLASLVFVIQRNGPDTDRLPSALTCFGRFLLPEYSSKSKLKERLTTAIENAKGFGLV